VIRNFLFYKKNQESRYKNRDRSHETATVHFSTKETKEKYKAKREKESGIKMQESGQESWEWDINLDP